MRSYLNDRVSIALERSRVSAFDIIFIGILDALCDWDKPSEIRFRNRAFVLLLILYAVVTAAIAIIYFIQIEHYDVFLLGMIIVAGLSVFYLFASVMHGTDCRSQARFLVMTQSFATASVLTSELVSATVVIGLFPVLLYSHFYSDHKGKTQILHLTLIGAVLIALRFSFFDNSLSQSFMFSQTSSTLTVFAFIITLALTYLSSIRRETSKSEIDWSRHLIPGLRSADLRWLEEVSINPRYLQAVAIDIVAEVDQDELFRLKKWIITRISLSIPHSATFTSSDGSRIVWLIPKSSASDKDLDLKGLAILSEIERMPVKLSDYTSSVAS